MPTRGAHAASYVGSPLLVGVTAPNMNNQTKSQIEMNSNSYVGQLRQEIASKPTFDIPPDRLRMFLGGTHSSLAIALSGHADQMYLTHYSSGMCCSRRLPSPDAAAAESCMSLVVSQEVLLAVAIFACQLCMFPDTSL